MSSAKAAFGVQMIFNSIAVGEVLDIGDALGFNRDLIDVTSHASPGGYEESIPKAIIRSDQFTIRCNSVIGNPGQAAIKSAWVAKSAQPLVISCPDGYYISGTAIVLGYKVVAELEEQLVFECNLKWTGAVTDGTTASNNITALMIATVELFPAFAADKYNYVGVSTADTCQFTATFAAGTANLYRNGVFVQALITETASGNISLGSEGDTTDISIVVTETGKAPVAYTFKIANSGA